MEGRPSRGVEKPTAASGSRSEATAGAGASQRVPCNGDCIDNTSSNQLASGRCGCCYAALPPDIFTAASVLAAQARTWDFCFVQQRTRQGRRAVERPRPSNMGRLPSSAASECCHRARPQAGRASDLESGEKCLASGSDRSTCCPVSPPSRTACFFNFCATPYASDLLPDVPFVGTVQLAAWTPHHARRRGRRVLRPSLVGGIYVATPCGTKSLNRTQY